MIEEWKKIDNYPRYSVSSLGRIRNDYTGRILSQCSHRYGYQFVCLSKNGHRKSLSVHRLVAFAFISNPLSLPSINHIDENKENNCVSNLEWCDQRYNVNYGSRGLKQSKTRLVLRLNKAKNNLSVYDKIARICIEQNRTLRDVGKEAGISSRNFPNWDGKNVPRLSSLKKIANALHVSVDTFLS